MSKSIWEISLTGDLNGKLVQLTGKISDFEKEVTSAEKKVSDFSIKILGFNQAAQAISNLLKPIVAVSDGLVEMDKQMKQVQMMSGLSDEAIGGLQLRANELASAYGGKPADEMAGFGQLLNKFGPEIAQNETAMTRMTASAFKLSKTMGGDVLGAFEAVTTMANQWGVSMDDPMKAAAFIDDILSKTAKSANLGSADIKDVSAAMAVMGNSAKEAGIKVSESLAMVQMLDRYANKKGAEGGTIGRNIIERLQKGRFTEREVLAELSDKKINIDVNMLADNTVPLITKLKEIKKLAQDPALMGKMFDSYNVAPLKSLLASLDEMEKVQGEIATSTLEDLDSMSDVIMGGIGEKMNRFKSQIQVLKNDLVAPFSGALPFITGTVEGLEGVITMAPGFLAITELSKQFALAQKWTALTTWWANFSFKSWMGSIATGVVEMGGFIGLLTLAGLQVLGEWIIGLVSATAAQLGFNVAMTANPIGAVIVGVAALIGTIALLVVYWDEITEGVKTFGRWIVNVIDGAIPGFKDFAKGVIDFIVAPFNWVGKIIKDLKNSFAALFGGKNEIEIDASVIADADTLTNSEKNNPFFDERKLARGSKTAGGEGSSGSNGDRSRFTNVNIVIQKLFDNININTSKINQSYTQIEDGLLRVVTNATNNLNNINFAGK